MYLSPNFYNNNFLNSTFFFEFIKKLYRLIFVVKKRYISKIFSKYFQKNPINVFLFLEFQLNEVTEIVPLKRLTSLDV
jgi:hypothetical protein